MPGSILPISAPSLAEIPRPAAKPNSAGSFQDVFSSAVQSVEGMRNDANSTIERFLSGEGEDLHTAALATQRA